MAGAAERAGDVPGAIAAVEAARTRLPASPLLARRLSDLYAAAGRWDDALSVEHELVDSLSPAAAAAETDTVCGLRYEAAMADPDRAQGLRRLLALGREHPAFVPAWVAAGDRLRESGRPFRARRAYEHGARARPATVLLERLAALDVEAKRPERTERRLARLRARHPHDAALLATLVRRQLERGALDDAEAALATGPDVPALAALRATCAARRGRADEAVALFERAVAELDGPGGARCTACRSRVDAWSARCPACGRWDVIETSGALMPSPSGNPAVDRCVGEGPG
jgi:tetratricopeptide (TPR) repeat protein